MIKISISKVSNQDLYTFGDHIRKLLSKFNVELLGILLFVQRFLQALTIFEASIEKQTASSEAVSILDSLRDNYFVALKGHLRNFEYHPVAEKRKKAQAIYDIITKEGEYIHKKAYSTQSAAFRAAIKEIDANYMEDIESLFAGEWYQFFKEAQRIFDEAIIKHTEQKADEKLIASATESRRDLENSLRTLFSFLPMQHELTQDNDLEDLIRKVQAEADRY